MEIHESQQGIFLRKAYEEFKNAKSIVDPVTYETVHLPEEKVLGYVDDVMYAFLAEDEAELSYGPRVRMMRDNGEWTSIVESKKVEEKTYPDLLSEVKERYHVGCVVTDIRTGWKLPITNPDQFQDLCGNTILYLLSDEETFCHPLNAAYIVVAENGNFAEITMKLRPELSNEIEPQVRETASSEIVFPFKIKKSNMEFNEKEIQAAVNVILEIPEADQAEFIKTVRDRIINIRLTETEQLNENILKEKERIQYLRDSIETI